MMLLLGLGLIGVIVLVAISPAFFPPDPKDDMVQQLLEDLHREPGAVLPGETSQRGRGEPPFQD